MSRHDRRAEAEMVAAIAVDLRPNAAGWARANCPLCEIRVGKRDRQRTLAIRPDTGFYLCWRCEARGHLPGHEKEPLPPREEPRQVAEIPLPDGFVPIDAKSAVLRAPREYLISRGVCAETIAAVGIGAVVRRGDARTAGRVIVPVKAGGRLIGWVGRDYTGRALLRYRYPAGMQRGRVLFNGDALGAQSELPVFVVEGVFDALRHWPHAVAVLGKPTEQQVGMLSVSRRSIVVALDGDAWVEGWALAQRLRLHGVRAGSLRLEPGEDPAGISPLDLIPRGIGCIEDDSTEERTCFRQV